MSVEQITVGQILAIIGSLVALITGISYLCKFISKAATKWLQSALAPTNAKIDDLHVKIDQVDRKVNASELEANKTILVRLLADVRNGNTLTDIERERLHETYQRYTAMGGNSYIRTEVERLKKEGKL